MTDQAPTIEERVDALERHMDGWIEKLDRIIDLLNERIA